MTELLGANLRGELHELGPGMLIDGKWELRALLGEGAFGKVYEAWHVRLGHHAAIKVLAGQRAGPKAKQRLLEEAQLMAGLSREHLIRATDYGELPDGSPYFVMDLVKGKSLRHLLEERLPTWRAVEIGEQILAGLVEVHRCGVVHGDVKPENVVIGEDDGKAWLLDFGLAQTSADEPEELGGTPCYMAPEMLLDRAPATARTDVYAAGAVLYEMLTGRLPRGHLGMGIATIRAEWANRRRAAPVLMHCKGVLEEHREALEELDKLVMEALARDPALRPKSAVPLLEELRRVRKRLSPEACSSTLTLQSGAVRMRSEESTTTSLKERGPSRQPWRAAAGLVGGAVLGGVLAWWGWSGRSDVGGTLEPMAEPMALETSEVGGSLTVDDVRAARGGILVAVPENASEPVIARFDALCKALGVDRPTGEGVLPVLCRRVLSGVENEALVELAEEAGARVVVFVGDGGAEELGVRSTEHDRGNALLARLDGLPLPRDPEAMAQVAPILEAVVGANTASGATGATDAEIEALDWKRIGARWGVLAEWLRAQQGHGSAEDLKRREALAHALDRMLAEDRERGEDRGVAAYRELAMLVWANSLPCDSAEPLRHELSTAEHRREIRLSALLDRAACLLQGSDPAARADEAEALVMEVFEASGDDPCVRVAAIGTISWIDRWKGGVARWEEHAKRLPPPSRCEPATWSREYAVRGDALVDGGRPCEAARAYALAYGALRTNVIALVTWPEYAWRCEPGLEVPRQQVNDALREALASGVFERPEHRVSIAYMRWWLTRDSADARRVLDEHAKVKEGEPAMLEGTASDLEAEICAGAKGEACSLRILARPKRAGDAERLRGSLGLP